MTNGTLDAIVALFQGASLPLFARIYTPMRTIFVLLFIIDFSWDAGMWLLADTPYFWGRVLRKLIVFSFLWGIVLTTPFWLWRILDGFAFLAKDLTGVAGLSPSGVLDAGVSLFFHMFDAWSSITSFFNPIAVFLRLFTALALLLAFVLIASAMLRILIEGALAMGALPFFLAFMGHKLTFGLSEGYLRYLLGLGVRLFILYLLIGVGSGLTTIWQSTLDNASAIATFTDPRIFLALPMTAILWATLVLFLPGRIANTIVGGFSLTALNPMGRAGR